jgi:predicted transcriptional regulator
MIPALPPLSESQLEIMNVVWDLGECTVADVLNQLQQRRTITRNTVHTMMSRLADKGWLKHRDEGAKFVYWASVPREQVQQQYVDRVVNAVFDGSAEGLVLALLQDRTLSREQASRIRRMIREAEERS